MDDPNSESLQRSVTAQAGTVVAAPRKTELAETTPAVIRWLSGALAAIAGAGIAALMLMTVVDIIRREQTGKGFQFSIELSEVALAAIVFAGLASAQLSNSHVTTPLLTQRLPAVWGNAVRLVGLVVVIALVGWMTYLTADEAYASWKSHEVRFGISRIPVWPAKAAIPIGLTAFELVLLSQLALTLRKARAAAIEGAGHRAA